MGGKGGGGYDTSAMEQATEKSLALQKQIYDQTRADSQPWYQAGVGGVNRLADLLGVSGGTVQNRDQVYNQLLPQYTSQSTQGQANQYVDRNGQVITISDPQAYFSAQLQGRQGDGTAEPLFGALNVAQAKNDYTDVYGRFGLKPYQTQMQNVNYDALNRAVEERLGKQALPSDYGSLLDRFDMSKFEEDPGYQFRLQQGQKALERQMAAQGDTFSPRAAKALLEYNQGMGAQEYGNAYNRYNTDQGNIYNRLAGIAGMGQVSTGTMAGAGQNYANAGTQLNTSLANAQTAAAQAEASQPSMFGNILGLGATALGSYFGSPAGGAAVGRLFGGK